MNKTDVLIIGAGPTGLFCAHQLGIIGLSCEIVDNLDKAGGQCIELYPDKPIYDIPAIPECTGEELTNNLLKQIKPFNVKTHFNQRVEELKKVQNRWHVKTSGKQEFDVASIVIAGGVGSFEPRKFPLKGCEKYEGKSADDISKKDKADFKRYQDIKAAWQESVDNAAPLRTRYSEMLRVTNLVIEKLDGSEQNTENINGLGISGEGVEQTLSIIVRNVEAGRKLEDLAGSLQGGVDYFSGQLDYYYNVDFDPRNIIGDDYSNAKETRYGNNTYEGPDASHGTHVGGIIGAERGNGIGMDGVADNVRIMTIRAVPDGDERDKDVAAAIRYAVDNGASVINMSFGNLFLLSSSKLHLPPIGLPSAPINIPDFFLTSL